MKTILVLSANPEGTVVLDLEREVAAIRKALEDSQYQDEFRVVHRAEVQWKDFWRSTEAFKPEIVHFSGHGLDEKGLCVVDEDGTIRVLSADALGRMFKLFPCVKCVVLSACYSEVQAKVVHQHVPCVVGMSLSIRDRAARDFAVAFYDGLGAKRDYREAFALGLSGMANDVEVWTPVLLWREPIAPPIDSSTVQPTSIDRASGVNPFTYGTPVSADRFYGRRRSIAEVKNRIGAASPQCLNLVGLRRSGKTSLLHYVRSRPDDFFTAGQKPLLVLLDLQDGRYHTPIGMNEGLRQGILDATGTSPWKEDQNDDPYAIEDALIALRESGVRLIVMLDELERIGQRLEVFQNWGDDWRSKASAELLTLVIATGRSLGEVYEQFSLTSPFANIFSKTVLGGLEPEVWRSLVREGLPRVTEGELEWVDAVSGGLPYYVQLAASMLFQYSDLAEAETEFWFQAEDRFGELWRDLNGPERSALKFAMGLGGVDAGRGGGCAIGWCGMGCCGGMDGCLVRHLRSGIGRMGVRYDRQRRRVLHNG